MSYTANELLKLASDYDNVATRALVVTAKKKEKKKLDPKAKVSNIGKGKKKTKKSSEYYDDLLNKYGQGAAGNPNDPFGLTPPKAPVGGPAGNPNNPFGLPTQQYGIFGKDPNYPLPINWNQQPQQPSPSTPQAMTGSPATPTSAAKPTHKSKFAPIDPIFQTMLGVNNDGAFGPQTRAALDIYKKSRNPGMSDELAFEYLRREPQYKAKVALPYDDNSNTYGSTANQIIRDNPF